MTREEAIALLNEQYETCKRIYDCSADQRKSYPNVPQFMEALDMALAALLPVSREQVEKVFPGCDFCKKELNDYPFITAMGEYGDSVNSHTPQYCPLCGRPLTPEAWKETRKNLEALKDA